MKTLLTLLIPFMLVTRVNAQTDRKINLPDIPGYYTLKCDLHIHTVFSDGSVWPVIRVEEAVRDNMDAIAMTEHLEYQPHKEDIPHPDRNRSYQIARDYAESMNIIVINGSEVTRNMPPGHSNAVFLQDDNKLLLDDPIAVFREARRQGAFIFWNHPNWTAQRKDGIATLTDMHKQLIKEKLLNGIEVANDLTYSDEALQIALDNNLAIIGTSDIHGLVDWQFDVPKGHRPLTLVFAKERSSGAIKEGLENKRTVACYDNYIIGRDEFLVPLITAILKIGDAKYQGNSQVVSVHIKNNSSLDFTIENESPYTFHNGGDVVSIKANGTTTLEVKTLKNLDNFQLKFKILNAIDAPGRHPEVTFDVRTN